MMYDTRWHQSHSHGLNDFQESSVVICSLKSDSHFHHGNVTVDGLSLHLMFRSCHMISG